MQIMIYRCLASRRQQQTVAAFIKSAANLRAPRNSAASGIAEKFEIFALCVLQLLHDLIVKLHDQRLLKNFIILELAYLFTKGVRGLIKVKISHVSCVAYHINNNWEAGLRLICIILLYLWDLNQLHLSQRRLLNDYYLLESLELFWWRANLHSRLKTWLW